MYSGAGILLVFAAIILVLNVTKKLYYGIIAGIVTAVLFFSVPLTTAGTLMLHSITSPSTLMMVLILYSITFLQRMLDRNGDIIRAQKSMDALSGNRRVNTILSPMIIGFLPAAGVVKIAGDIVSESAGEYLDKEEKAFVSSYYRHVSESILPTYTSILLAINLSGVKTSSFVIAMLPMAVVQVALGYFFYLRKIPKQTEAPPSEDRKKDLLIVLGGLWPLLLVIALILAFNVPTLAAICVSILLYLVIKKIPLSLIPRFLVSAFETRLIINMFLIYIFKDIITYTGVITELPSLFSKLPIPQFLVFMLLFFFGSVVGGSNMIHSIGVPLAYTAIPSGGIPLIVLLNCASYIAMQVSPTHVCLGIVTEHFGVNMLGIVKKTLPVLLSFLVIALAYYLLLSTILY